MPCSLSGPDTHRLRQNHYLNARPHPRTDAVTPKSDHLMLYPINGFLLGIMPILEGAWLLSRNSE